MKNIQRGFLFFTFLLVSQILLATGPSYIYAQMNPVSVNENGDILFRTRFTANWMGAHDLQIIEYGLCVWSNNEMKEFLTKEFTPEWHSENRNIEREQQVIAHWDSIFKTGLNFEKLSKQQKKISEEYNFLANNVEQYKVDKVYSLADFEKEYGFDPSSKIQRSLKGSRSLNFCANKQIKVMYKIGDIFIVENEAEVDSMYCVGSEFDYVSFKLKDENIYYDMFSITSVLVK